VRHVLIIHYHFLPVHNVAVKRLANYASRLPHFGWQPVVLTREWQGLDEADPCWGLTWAPELERAAEYPIYRAREGHGSRPRAQEFAPAPTAPGRDTWFGRQTGKAVRKADRMRRMLPGRYPDEFRGWVGPAVAEGARVAARYRLDAIVSYCPPETNHLVASRLTRQLGVPWIPFFADLYGFLDPPLPPHSVEGMLRRAWHRRCLAPAAACAAVSPAMVEYLATVYGKRTELVLTGFDPSATSAPSLPAPPRDRLVVSHLGSVYPGDQRPELLFDGLDTLLRGHPEVESRLEVRLVGSQCEARLEAMLDGRPAARVCVIRPTVDAAAAAALLAESHGVLALNCTAHRDRYGTLSYPTKIFEAFGAAKPILAIPSDGDYVDALLARTGAGVSAGDAGGIAGRLWEWFDAWSRTGRLPYDGRPAEIAELTLDRQVERLANLLESVRR
jgi:glycosyltransferase involved in cell wall biosynthesis